MFMIAALSVILAASDPDGEPQEPQISVPSCSLVDKADIAAYNAAKEAGQSAAEGNSLRRMAGAFDLCAEQAAKSGDIPGATSALIGEAILHLGSADSMHEAGNTFGTSTEIEQSMSAVHSAMDLSQGQFRAKDAMILINASMLRIRIWNLQMPTDSTIPT